MSEILIDSELLSCPICADTFVDACDTGCGHTFCEFCLNSCLESKPDKCPVCSKDPSPVHPAFTIRAICNAVAPHVVEDPSMTVESEKELGNSSYYKNKYAQAILHYNNAINKCTHTDPKNSYLYNNRSQCFIHLRQFKRALDDCDEAIRLNDDNIKAYMRKGLCLRMLGHFEESRAAYNKASVLDKNSEWKQQIQDGLKFLPALSSQSSNQSQTQPQQPQRQQAQPQAQPQQPQYQQQQQQQQPQYYFPYGTQHYTQQSGGYPQFNQQHARYQYPGHYTVGRTASTQSQNFHPNYQYHQSNIPQQPQPVPQPQPPQSNNNVNNNTNNNNNNNNNTTTTSTTSNTNPSNTSAANSTSSSTSNSTSSTSRSSQPATTATASSSSNSKRNRSSSGNCKNQ